MVLDLINVHGFRYEMRAGTKMSFFLELIIVLMCILIIKKGYLSSW